MCDRPEYDLQLRINNKILNRVVIDQHYRLKHPEVTDEIILNLVRNLDLGVYPIEDRKDGFEYSHMYI
ncbi:hypothetical protein OAB57_01455 [Bacteriovoracaceae bacterium]|nr:hypothetical protein [Bacteriovoracaceae bacterium]